MRKVINSERSLSEAIGQLRQGYEQKKYVVMSLRFGKDRSVKQNALAHSWYAQAARELCEETAEEVKCKCKLHLGVPILLEDLEFTVEGHNYSELYQSLIAPLCYEAQLLAMIHFPVTRCFTTQQHNQYLEGMVRNYGKRGVLLQFPEDFERGVA